MKKKKEMESGGSKVGQDDFPSFQLIVHVAIKRRTLGFLISTPKIRDSDNKHVGSLISDWRKYQFCNEPVARAIPIPRRGFRLSARICNLTRARWAQVISVNCAKRHVYSDRAIDSVYE